MKAIQQYRDKIKQLKAEANPARDIRFKGGLERLNINDKMRFTEHKVDGRLALNLFINAQNSVARSSLDSYQQSYKSQSIN